MQVIAQLATTDPELHALLTSGPPLDKDEDIDELTRALDSLSRLGLGGEQPAEPGAEADGGDQQGADFDEEVCCVCVCALGVGKEKGKTKDGIAIWQRGTHVFRIESRQGQEDACTHTYTYSHTCTHAHTCTYTYTHTGSQTRMRARAHTHTHTQEISDAELLEAARYDPDLAALLRGEKVGGLDLDRALDRCEGMQHYIACTTLLPRAHYCVQNGLPKTRPRRCCALTA
eukprot:1149083-Pelagomonas_calceolata.AAC.1